TTKVSLSSFDNRVNLGIREFRLCFKETKRTKFLISSEDSIAKKKKKIVFKWIPLSRILNKCLADGTDTPCITAQYSFGMENGFHLPEEARELDKEVRQIIKEKEVIRNQDFEKAREVRDREMDIKAQISTLVEKDKEMSKTESEARDEGPIVTEANIQHIVSSWTGIPVEKDEAVKAISQAIRQDWVGLKNPNRPIASFIFSSPTGMGNSKLAKALVAYYFGFEEAMVRLDMSEFRKAHCF
ncbi:hypothetical protein CR513_36361, partial [Mucuna pruriens]